MHKKANKKTGAFFCLVQFFCEHNNVFISILTLKLKHSQTLLIRLMSEINFIIKMNVIQHAILNIKGEWFFILKHSFTHTRLSTEGLQMRWKLILMSAKQQWLFKINVLVCVWGGGGRLYVCERGEGFEKAICVSVCVCVCASVDVGQVLRASSNRG